MTVFNNSVFINCPFDNTYHVLSHSMLFTVVALGLQPRIAIETSDAGETRLDKIISLLKESEYVRRNYENIRQDWYCF